MQAVDAVVDCTVSYAGFVLYFHNETSKLPGRYLLASKQYEAADIGSQVFHSFIRKSVGAKILFAFLPKP